MPNALLISEANTTLSPYHYYCPLLRGLEYLNTYDTPEACQVLRPHCFPVF